MLRTRYISALAALAIAAMPFAASAQDHAQAAPAARAQEEAASIPFANRGGVRDWRAQGMDRIYFQDSHGQWYLAKLMGSASDLPFTEFIGIDANPDGSLDKFSAIYVKGQKYPFESFVKVDGPPSKKARAKRKG